MNKDQKIFYVVSEGSYEEYNEVGIFSTKSLAKEFMEVVPSSEYNEIKELELDKYVYIIEQVRQGLSPWFVGMEKNGEVVESRLLKVYIRALPFFPLYRGRLNATVWAHSSEEAIKIVDEKRLQMISMEEW